MNETEFEQHLASALRLILPTFQPSAISSQKSFSIKFGHHNVLVDGKLSGDRAKMGIYDILIIIGGNPIIMLELKRPHLKLTDDDRDQGISYARLTDPITPVTIITNGSDFNVYDTYSKERIESEDMDNDFFLKRLHQAAILSKNAYKDSILTLIENDQRLLFDLLNSISDATFRQLIGPAGDVSKPIVEGFCVPREILGTLDAAVKKHQFVYLPAMPMQERPIFYTSFTSIP
ncbi:type I restriction endonuclease [Flavobacterium sp. RHBU_24]|uniref:type I restriction endonuclease n=1 Tax=Flavobacterium sp. RHBU_24 TaxID=3391185 RepID=UPI003984F83B